MQDARCKMQEARGQRQSQKQKVKAKSKKAKGGEATGKTQGVRGKR
jgi:hypothetical protein